MKGVVLAAALCVVVLGVSGCATSTESEPEASRSASPKPSTSADPTPSEAPPPASASPTASPTASPSPSATPPASSPPPGDANAVTCLNLLDDATQQRLTTEADTGLAIIDGWGAKMRREGSILARFEDLGGVSCAVGFVGTDNIAPYAWSPITAAAKGEIRPRISAEGMVTVPDSRGELWCIPTDLADPGFDACYLFRANDWFFADDKPLLTRYIAAVDGR